MGETFSQLIHLEVRCTHDAPCLVREAVDDALDGCRMREQARLIASELVTNAVLHSGAGPDEVLEFQAIVADGALVIAVTDPCLAGQDAHIREEDPNGGGYGLRIVDQLAREWGSEHRAGQRVRAGSDQPGGQRVWAELLVSH